MKKSILIIITSAIFMGSCSEENGNCRLNYKDIIKKDSIYFVKTINKNGSFQIFDKTQDSIPTGFYIFDSIGLLKAYRFLTSPVSYIYSEDYSNKKWKSIGSPLVNQTLFLKRDSCYLTLNYFSLNKRYTQIYFYNYLDSVKLTLSKSNVYSNMLCTTVKVRFKESDSTINGIVKAEYINECSQFTYSLTDTIHIDLRAFSLKTPSP